MTVFTGIEFITHLGGQQSLFDLDVAPLNYDYLASFDHYERLNLEMGDHPAMTQPV